MAIGVVAPPAPLKQCQFQNAIRDLPETLLLLNIGIKSPTDQAVAPYCYLKYCGSQLDVYLWQHAKGVTPKEFNLSIGCL